MDSHSGTRAAMGRLSRVSMDGGSKWQMAIVTLLGLLASPQPDTCKERFPQNTTGRWVGRYPPVFLPRPAFLMGVEAEAEGGKGGMESELKS